MTEARTGFGNLAAMQGDFAAMAFIAKQILNGMATATLVRVSAVNGDEVDVQPLVGQIDGSGKVVDHGTIHGMPWFSLRSGTCQVRVAPTKGDIGLAVFCHSDISSVKEARAPAAPGSRRRFDWSDGVYFGGLLGQTATTYIDVAPGQVEIRAATIKLTGDVQISGDTNVAKTLTAATDVVGGGKSLKSHTHPANGAPPS